MSQDPMKTRRFLDEDKSLVARQGICEGAAVLGCLLLACRQLALLARLLEDYSQERVPPIA